MPTPAQAHQVLIKKYSKEQLKAALAGIDMILSAIEHVANTHTENPALSETGVKTR